MRSYYLSEKLLTMDKLTLLVMFCPIVLGYYCGEPDLKCYCAPWMQSIVCSNFNLTIFPTFTDQEIQETRLLDIYNTSLEKLPNLSDWTVLSTVILENNKLIPCIDIQQLDLNYPDIYIVYGKCFSPILTGNSNFPKTSPERFKNIASSSSTMTTTVLPATSTLNNSRFQDRNDSSSCPPCRCEFASYQGYMWEMKSHMKEDICTISNYNCGLILFSISLMGIFQAINIKRTNKKKLIKENIFMPNLNTPV